MKARHGIFPLKQLKQLCIVVAVELKQKKVLLTPNTPQEAKSN